MACRIDGCKVEVKVKDIASGNFVFINDLTSTSFTESKDGGSDSTQYLGSCSTNTATCNWTLSLAGHYCTDSTGQSVFTCNKEVEIKIFPTGDTGAGTDPVFQGKARVNSRTLNFPADGKVDFTAELESTEGYTVNNMW